MSGHPPKPTLWRTGRALANRKRLRLLALLFETPDQTVTEVARRAGLPVPVASQYLRALNARGLLQVKRTGRWVRYRPGADVTGSPTERLLQALRQSFRRDRDAVERIFKSATAFTHPRRVELWQALVRGAHSVEELHGRTRISRPALARHLDKLQSRGLVSVRSSRYAAMQPQWPVAQALVEMAGET